MNRGQWARWRKDHPATYETWRQRMAASKIGSKASARSRKKNSVSHAGIKPSRETRNKMSLAGYRRYARAPLIKKTCPECGRPFETRTGASYCSRKCKERVNNRERRAGVLFRERVFYFEIFKRDEGICKICGKPVDPSYVGHHPLAGSLDHVVGLREGGLHRSDNIQLAHIHCNVRKSRIAA